MAQSIVLGIKFVECRISHGKFNVAFVCVVPVGDVGEYQVPYQNCVPNDPSIEDMKKVVVTQEIRPGIDERWNKHEVIIITILYTCL